MATARENVERFLRCIELDQLVSVTVETEDGVFGWPTGRPVPMEVDEREWMVSELEAYCINNGWLRDPKAIAEHHHGEGARSYREPLGEHPAMQFVFHRSPGWDFVELSPDFSAPMVDVVDTVRHGAEVLDNLVHRKKTDPNEMAAMLDRRFGESSDSVA